MSNADSAAARERSETLARNSSESAKAMTFRADHACRVFRHAWLTKAVFAQKIGDAGSLLETKNRKPC